MSRRRAGLLAALPRLASRRRRAGLPAEPPRPRSRRRPDPHAPPSPLPQPV